MKKHVYSAKWLFVFGTAFFLTLSASAQWSTAGGNVSQNNTYAGNYSFARDNRNTLYVAFADNGNQSSVNVIAFRFKAGCLCQSPGKWGRLLRWASRLKAG